MNREQKVKINLAADANPPVVFCKAKLKPDARQFSFKPKAFQQLDEYVQSVKWNSVDKTIDVCLTENPDFDGYRWLQWLGEQFQELQKSPFVDTNSSAILLVFKDEEGNDAATVKFKNLEVAKHEVSMYKGSTTSYGTDTSAQALTHFITLRYQYAEFSVLEHKPECEVVELKDKEWQTVETP